MVGRNNLLKKRNNYERSKRATEFEKNYGNERSYGQAIINEQDLKEQVIKFQKAKEKYSKESAEIGSGLLEGENERLKK